VLHGALVVRSVSGLAPQFVGVNQLNVQVPSGVESGSAVPLLIQVNGVPQVSTTNQVMVDTIKAVTGRARGRLGFLGKRVAGF
jgi:uncharacterized protein (TIGR03437 family)